MEPASLETVSASASRPAAPRRLLAPLLALLLGGGLLAVWLTAASARQLDYPSDPAAQIYPATLTHLPDNQAGKVNAPPLAPLAAYDLAIQKTQNPQYFHYGSDNFYIINILRLNSDLVPSGFSVEDTLPGGMTWTPVPTIGNWDCASSTTQKVSCFYTKTITGTTIIDPLIFEVFVPVTVPDIVYNTAYLYFNNITKSSTVQTPIRVADLALSKKQAPSSVPTVNTLISYTLIVTNTGPFVALNAVVTETLPAYLNPYSSTIGSPTNPTKGTFLVSENPNIYIWSIGNMNVGDVEKLVLTTWPISPTANGKTITNKAGAYNDIQELNRNNNFASTSFFVGGLDVKKIGPYQSDILAGENISFTIEVKNVSGGSLSGITVQDVITDSLTKVNCRIITLSNNISCLTSSQNLYTSLPTLASNQTASVVVTVRGNDKIGAAPLTIKNHATVSWGSPKITQDTNEIEFTIGAGGFIQIGKTDVFQQGVERSQYITYTVSITNVGSLPIVADSIWVTDTFNNLDYYLLDKNGLNMVEGPSTESTRSWNIKGVPLAPKAKISFIIGAKVNVNATNRVINQVDVSAFDEYNHFLRATNQDIDTIFITDLAISKFVSKQILNVGETFTYTIIITNTSNPTRTINNIIVNDTFSSYLDPLSCKTFPPTGTPPNCFITNKVLSTYVSLAYKQSAKVIVTARGNSSIGNLFKNIANTASVTWDTPAKTRNSNEVDITINASSYLQVSKSDNLDTVYAGESITYTISITNIGSLATTANTLRVTDTFLSNVSYVNLNTNGLTMELVYNSGITRAWNIKNKALNPGEKITFMIGAKVTSGASGTAENNVSVFVNDTPLAKTYDLNVISASPVATLKYIKSVSPAQAKVGETFTFKIELQNRGTNTLYNVRVSDIFPSQLDLVSATTSRGTATVSTSAREVEVVISSLSNGEAATIAIQAKVNTSVATPKTLRNRAELKWNGSDTILSNSVAYRVLASGSLPGTGLDWLTAQASWSAAVSPLLGGLSVALAALGLALLAYSLWATSRRPLYAGRYLRSGLGVLALAAVFGLSALIARSSPAGGSQVAALSGTKPPLASSAASASPTQLPASPSPAALTTAEATLAAALAAPDALRPTEDPRLPTPDPVQPTPTLTHGEVDISYLLPTATPVNLPQYDIPTPTLMPLTGPDGGSPDSSAVTRLVIPKMGLDTVVQYVPFSGSTWLISGLKQEIAWMGDTSWPGLGGNTGLAGHVDLVTGAKGPFWNLKDLKVGDEVVVYTEKNIYSYRVRQQVVVEDYDLSVIEATDKPQVTLITCTTWDPDLRMYTRRLVIYADLSGVRPR